ncbi:MAG: DNA-processing protein DprA [Cellulomonadaceae bacterium]
MSAQAGSRDDTFEDDRLVAAAWSRLAEPGDDVAGRLVRRLGADAALRWVLAADGPPEHRERAVRALAERTGEDGRTALAAMTRALGRWAARIDGLDPARDLRWLEAMGGTLLVPGGHGWPAGLDALGDACPFALWARGQDLESGLPRLERSVALVGARASTDYGQNVAADMACGLAERDFAVVSGGAYGIDAAAHRGALAGRGHTVVLLAGGVDRPYPAGNARLFAGVLDGGGVVASEVPPGSVPSRNRFLSRNRLIAALGSATVVVEAAWRSGALSTATHAAELLRPVGAVPGPVTSMASAGCHRLLREGRAVCVTDAAEAAELAGRPGCDLVNEPVGRVEAHDDLGEAARRVYDALPLRSWASIESVARAAGLGPPEVLGALGELELRQLARYEARGWQRRKAEPRAPTR